MALVSLSAIAAQTTTTEWTKYKNGDGKIPKGDCLEMMCEYGGDYAFWSGGLKSLTKEQLSELERIYVKLVFAYMPEYIEERTEMFIATNGYRETEILLRCPAHMYDDPETLPEPLRGPYTEFIEDYYFNKPCDAELRKDVICSLEMKYKTDYYFSTTDTTQYMYNCIPSFICMILLGVAALLTRKWVYALITLGMILKDTVVFFGAPIPVYMYYFSTQLVCSMMMMFCIACIMHRKMTSSNSKQQ